MANVKDGKKKNDGPSSSKAQVPKTPKKKGQKFAPAISQPSLPKSMKYVIKRISTHSLKFGPTYNNDFVEYLKKYMNVEAFELFTSTFIPATIRAKYQNACCFLRLSRITVMNSIFGM
ncbi:hypothetical protein RDI58_026815 [Solanum bulbocastanum]|uniref:Uncharacterized protein n=1 Tax=Solanum bulbocastanum TaxID=147425 RepID=A0AAN8SUQ0_SOLBU